MSTIYNHRTLQPTGGPPAAVPRQRVDDSLDVIRQEFDYMSQELSAMRNQRDEYEAKIASQVNELNIIRQSLYDLETQHGKIQQHYEEEIGRARAESRAAAAAVAQAAAASNSSGTSQAQSGPAPPPGVVGPGGPPPGAPSSAGTTAPPGPAGAGGPPSSTGPAPPPPGLGVGVGGPPGLSASGPGAPAGMYPEYYTPSAVPGGLVDSARERELREREREREREVRERDGRDRDRERERGDRGRDRERERERGDRPGGGVIVDRDVIMRDPREQLQRERMGGPPIPTGMSMNPMGGPGGPVSVMSDRERDLRERDRDRLDRERLGERDLRDRDRERERDRPIDRGERERERLADARDPKRLKSERDRVKTSSATAAGGDRPGPSDHFSPSLGHAHHTPKLPPHPPATGLSGMGGGPPPPGMGGPGLPPQQPGQAPGGGGAYPPAEGNSLGLIPLSGPGGSGPSQGGGGPSNPSANPASSSQALIPSQQQGPSGPPSALSFPDDIDIHTISPEHKREGADWFALFNHKVKRVLDVNLVHTLMHESVVCCVRFSADGKYLATGCNRTAQIYDAKTGVKTCILADDSAGQSGDLYIRSVCFSPDGKSLATGAEDKKIRMWDIAKKRIRNVFDGHQQEIYSLDFSLDGRLIVSGSGDKTARIWDMLDGTSKILTINDLDSVNNDAGVTSVAISPDGRYVAAGSLDTIVRIWDVATGFLVERLRGHRDSVYSVAFTPDGKGLVSGSLDKTLKYWDVSGLALGGPGGTSNKGVKKEGGGGSTGRKDVEKGSQCLMNFTGHKDYVLSVAVSHDGQWIVSGSKDRGVQFWDARNAIVQCMLQGHKNSVISIDLSPAGNYLATGSGDWQARIWSYGSMNG